MSEEEENFKFDVPQGMTNPWVFIQKRIIFESKIKLSEAFNQYERIYTQEKVNNNKFQIVLCYMKQLYREIRPSVLKNTEIKEELAKTVKFLEILISKDIKINEEQFPMIIVYYNDVLQMLSYIGLTNIEIKGENPGSAIICSDSH